MEIDGDIDKWYYKQILNCHHNNIHFIYTRLSRRLVEEELALAISPLKNTFFTKTSLTRYFNQQNRELIQMSYLFGFTFK